MGDLSKFSVPSSQLMLAPFLLFFQIEKKYHKLYNSNMRKFSVVALCFVLFEMMGCTFFSGTGKVLFQLPGDGNTNVRYADARGRVNSNPTAMGEEPYKYVITVTFAPDNIVIYNQEHQAGDIISIEGLTPGKYDIFVSMKHGDYLYRGSDSVKVVARTTTSANINLNKKVKVCYYVKSMQNNGTGTKEAPYSSIDEALSKIDNTILNTELVTLYVLGDINHVTLNQKQKVNLLIEGVGDNAKIYAESQYSTGNSEYRAVTINGNLADTKVAFKNIKITHGNPKTSETKPESKKGGGIAIFGGEVTLLDNVEIYGNNAPEGKEIYIGPASNAKLTINGNINIYPKVEFSSVPDRYHSIYMENDSVITLGKKADLKKQLLCETTMTKGRQIYQGDSEALKRCYEKIRISHENQNNGYYIDRNGKIDTRYVYSTLNTLTTFPEELMIIASTKEDCQNISKWLSNNAARLNNTPIDLFIGSEASGISETEWNFKNCEANLKKVTLNCGDNPKSSFYGCKSLETLIVTSNVSRLNENSFAACPNLTKLYMQNNKQWTITGMQAPYQPTHNPVTDAQKLRETADKKWNRKG